MKTSLQFGTINEKSDRDMYLRVRLSNDTIVENFRLEDLFLYAPETFKPWRSPAAYKEQKHLPGYFWMSQTRQLINYESRLEMTILKQLDFDEQVTFVLPQPFELHFWVGASKRRHIPDFLVWRKNAPLLLVNVKPKVFTEKPRNRDSFSACDTISQLVRLEHRVCCEPEPVYFANLRWLAGFRCEPIAMPQVALKLMERLESATPTFGQWIAGIGEEELTRPVAFHLMWKRKALFSTSRILSNDTSMWLGV